VPAASGACRARRILPEEDFDAAFEELAKEATRATPV